MNLSQKNLETISGSVERVTFYSEETGFCVLRTKIKGKKELVTVVGNAANITAGESIECRGLWINNKEYGIQFKAEHLTVVSPTTLEGIEKYLSSGFIKGIGSHFAKVLTKSFGEKVFEIIENEPNRLTRLSGIGSKRKSMILASWAEQKVVRDIMIFLQSNGIGTARAVRIYKIYGNNSINIVRDNPYKLSLDIIGIGFKTADILALRLGVPKNSIKRAQAGIRYVLQEFSSKGHCAIEQEHLIKLSVELLETSSEAITQAIDNEIAEERLVPDTINSKTCLFLKNLYQAECLSAKNIERLKNAKSSFEITSHAKALQWVENKISITLSSSQRQAVITALKEKVVVITGGPGVGKTTIINSILKIALAKKAVVSLCAPTGRAAKRLTEATGLTAKTIHRLLEYDPKTRAFRHNQNNLLSIDMIIIDEASMIDISLLNDILKSIPDHASLLIVGDIDQLPSVGPGAVLADIINSKTITVVRLTEIFRQAASSQIIVNAHRINQGQFPTSNATSSELSDFYFIQAETSEEIQEKLLFTITERIPDRFNFNPKKDIQVLTPMNKGGLGSRSLNTILQAKLNPNSEPKINRFDTIFAPGDKIIQNINNYDKEVFNGDIGIISSIDLKESEVKINFDDHIVTYNFNELDEISLAYAISIHKSQGSEYPVVVIPIATQHQALLARNLLYTAVTRGKKLVIIIGQTKAIAIAIKNNSTGARITNLQSRLKK